MMSAARLIGRRHGNERAGMLMDFFRRGATRVHSLARTIRRVYRL